MSEFLEETAKSGHMCECWRCGIEFDASDVLQGAPCPDCRLSLEPFEWRKLNAVVEAEERRKIALVRAGWQERLPDAVIAENIGLNKHQVTYLRKKLGLEGHDFSGTQLWGDIDEVREKIREASQRYWDSPESKKRRKRGPAVAGNYGNDRSGRKKTEIDKRYEEK